MQTTNTTAPTMMPISAPKLKLILGPPEPVEPGVGVGPEVPALVAELVPREVDEKVMPEVVVREVVGEPVPVDVPEGVTVTVTVDVDPVSRCVASDALKSELNCRTRASAEVMELRSGKQRLCFLLSLS